MKRALNLIPIVALALFGQARLDPSRQERAVCVGAIGPTVYMNAGNATMVCAALDGTTLKLANGILSATTPPASAQLVTTWNETPVGTIDGSNTVFTLAFTPMVDVLVRLNGFPQDGGGYTLSGRAITFTTAPQSGDTVRVAYQHQ